MNQWALAEKLPVIPATRAGTVPAYLHCRGTCTTVQYKSRIRADIESSGCDVIADVGDQ
jgi:hypothetical protein